MHLTKLIVNQQLHMIIIDSNIVQNLDTKAGFLLTTLKINFPFAKIYYKKHMKSNYYHYFVEITTSKFRHGFMRMWAPRGSGFRKERVFRRESEQTERKKKKERGLRERVEERIVESNIRRTFTVRFPNLYCVWQRCRDIRGSYRNVLLLIVLHPEGNRRPRTKGSVPNGDGKSGRFERTRDEEQEEGGGEGQKGVVYSREREKKRERA